ncbi:hypothetical protein ACP70R_006915 [Stipagrostis hirtigluma subsp. patula]
MDALLHAKHLAAAAAELHLHQAAAVIFVGGVAIGVILFRKAVPSLDFLGARRQAPILLRSTASDIAATAGSASTSPLPHFAAICLAMGALLHAELLVGSAAKVHLHQAVVTCVVLAAAVLFHWAILSFINILAARRPAEREPKKLLRPTPPTASAAAARSSNIARSAWLVLSALVSASWFVEPFAAAACEIGLPSAAVLVTVVFVAALFNVSIHSFRSFFLPRPPPAAASVSQREGSAASAAAVVGMVSAACLAAAGGSAYFYAPARR